jgi:hypothetical protein
MSINQGELMNTGLRKTALATGVAVIATVSLVACGSSTGSTDVASSAAPQATSAAPAPTAAASEAASATPEASSAASAEALGAVLDGKKIAYIMPGAAEYYVLSSKGAQAAAAALGGDAKVFDSTFDVSK